MRDARGRLILLRSIRRREFLQGAMSLAVLPIFAGRAEAEHREGEVSQGMGKDIVMVHGANEGAWCFDKFRAVFEGLGWTCHAPDLIGHGTKAADAAKTLVGIGMADYRVELEAFRKTVSPQA